MKFLQFFIGLLCVTLIHVLGQRFFSQFSLVIDPFLVLVVYYSLHNNPAWSSVVGSVAGLAHDSLSGGLYGLHGFADTLVAHVSSRLQQRLVVQQPLQVGLLFVLASAFQLTILATLQFWLVGGSELPGLGSMTARMMTSGLAGVILLVIKGQVRELDASWRARQRRRLKI